MPDQRAPLYQVVEYVGRFGLLDRFTPLSEALCLYSSVNHPLYFINITNSIPSSA